MFTRIFLFTFSISLFFVPTLSGQAAKKAALNAVDIRVVLHGPSIPTENLYYIDNNGEVQTVNFRYKSLSRSFSVSPLKGALVFYNKAEIDPENPEASSESIAAIAKIPEGMKKGIAVVVPRPPEKKPSFSMLMIEDSPNAFPAGESIILPFLNTRVIVQAGEHVVPVRPGQLARIPFVEEKNKFNMAQTNFHYEQDGEWVTFAERRLQYLKATRRLFIIDYTPGASTPTITCIMDNSFQSR